jgi:(+)-trans-carveol dehydrogenase
VGRVEGKVALVTGAARGQGRSHALRLAEEGANIIAVDLCQQMGSVPYDLSSSEDLAETVRLVEKMDRRIVAREADVRDGQAMRDVVAEGVAEFGRLDVVCANAGICVPSPVGDIDEQEWDETMGVNLTGVFRTVQAALPTLIEQGQGGSIIMTSSVSGAKGLPGMAHYVASKHGVVGLMKSLANELGPLSIRVNTVNPGNVGTPMLINDSIFKLFLPDVDSPTVEDFEPISKSCHTLPVTWLEPRDISNAVLFLASDEARYVTGTALSVDAGMTGK